MIRVEIFTDGACLGNPGPGGYAYLLRSGVHEKLGSGGEKLTTNNRMELQAVIEALKLICKPCIIDLYTDSQYVQKGMKEWIHSWKKKNWLTKEGVERKNTDLWKELDALAGLLTINWYWVRGHNGHVENERVDAAARQAAEKFK